MLCGPLIGVERITMVCGHGASPDLSRRLVLGAPLTSAALNILLYHDAAVSEHRTGHVG